MAKVTDLKRNSHGTVYSYQKLGCACVSCKAAWANYMRDYRAKGNDAMPSGYELDVPAIAKEIWEHGLKQRAQENITRDSNQQNQTATTPDHSRYQSEFLGAEAPVRIPRINTAA
jgi:hypothetical protein